MNLVTLENVSKQYSERLLLDSVNLQINTGDKIGLIGPNGSGKTTLLYLIAQQEPPDTGTVMVWGGVRVQYLPQVPPLVDSMSVLDYLFASDEPQIRLLRDYEWATQKLQQSPDDSAWQEQISILSDKLNQSNGWAAEVKIKTILTQLGITDFEALIGTLSGGQRKRVALARALFEPADLLILDEPTNHIDAETIEWLESYLATEPKALLMVTHDRYFLDRVVNRIVELDRRDLVSYPGNYSQYLQLSAARHEQLLQTEGNRERLLKRELEWLRRAPQARGTKQKARTQRVLEMQVLVQDSRKNQVVLNLATRRLGKKVLRVSDLSKSFEARSLFKQAEFTLKPEDRIGIMGPNGTGKSTFLNILAGKLAPDSGHVEWGDTVHLGYYDQQSDKLADSMRVIDFIEQQAPLIETKDGTRLSAFQMLEWFLFDRKQQYTQIGSLSGGERRRLYLLYVLMHQPNVLLLDEPTNDLDIQTLAVLEEFLDHFAGSLVVVSHDRYFLDRTVDYLVCFEDGRLSQPYPTPFSTYLRLRAENQAETKEPTPKRASIKTPNEIAKPRKLSWKEQQELAALEEKLGLLEAEKETVQANINDSGYDYQRLQQLAAQLQDVEMELESILERWLELSDIAEGHSS